MKKILLPGFLCYFLFSITQAQQLDYFIKQGLYNSPLLKEYQNQLGISEVDSLLISAGHKPQVNSNSQVLYAPVYNNFGYDEAVTNGGNYASVVDVTQYIFNGRTLKNKYENIALQNKLLRNTTKITTNELIKTITGQYLTTLSDFNELNNCSSYLDIINQQKSIIKQLVSQAIYKQSDYLTLEIEAQTAEINFNQIQTQFIKDVSILKQICGIKDTVQTIPELPVIKISTPVSPEKSPLFLQYTIDSLKLINEQESIKLQYLPKINWFADAGFMSSTPIFYHYFGYSVGLNITIPIFDGHQRKMEYQKISIKENTRLNYENYFKNLYSKQVEQLQHELQVNQRTFQILKSQESSTQELIALLNNQLNSGNTTITELINAMKNYLSVSRNINQTQLKEFEIINELNYLMQF
jgi:outer membrane protein TolC